MKMYFKCILCILFYSVVFGFCLPFLISSTSSELVFLGIVLIVLAFVPIVFYGSKLVNYIKEKMDA